MTSRNQSNLDPNVDPFTVILIVKVLKEAAVTAAVIYKILKSPQFTADMRNDQITVTSVIDPNNNGQDVQKNQVQLTATYSDPALTDSTITDYAKANFLNAASATKITIKSPDDVYVEDPASFFTQQIVANLYDGAPNGTLTFNTVKNVISGLPTVQKARLARLSIQNPFDQVAWLVAPAVTDAIVGAVGAAYNSTRLGPVSGNVNPSVSSASFLDGLVSTIDDVADGVGNIMSLIYAPTLFTESPSISQCLAVKHTAKMVALGSASAAKDYIKYHPVPSGFTTEQLGGWLDGLRDIAIAAANAAAKYGPTIVSIANNFTKQKFTTVMDISDPSVIPFINKLDLPLVQNPVDSDTFMNVAREGALVSTNATHRALMDTLDMYGNVNIPYLEQSSELLAPVLGTLQKSLNIGSSIKNVQDLTTLSTVRANAMGLGITGYMRGASTYYAKKTADTNNVENLSFSFNDLLDTIGSIATTAAHVATAVAPLLLL